MSEEVSEYKPSVAQHHLGAGLQDEELVVVNDIVTST